MTRSSSKAGTPKVEVKITLGKVLEAVSGGDKVAHTCTVHVLASVLYLSSLPTCYRAVGGEWKSTSPEMRIDIISDLTVSTQIEDRCSSTFIDDARTVVSFRFVSAYQYCTLTIHQWSLCPLCSLYLLESELKKEHE